MRVLLRVYQLFVSPAIHWLAGPGYGCRFSPTCSHYARDALRAHGPLRGGWLALVRILRCQPFSTGGFDPVPLSKLRNSRAISRAST